MKGGVLSVRQRQVLTLAAFGNTSAQIARILGVGTPTVQKHLEVAYAALGAQDRATAVAVAIHLGEISLGDVARIADAAAARLAARRSEPADAPLAPVGVMDGAPEGRTAPRTPQRRTGPRGEAAA